MGIPAKVPATELDPGAKRAKMGLERQGLQMVCRLLAFNAEAWLAEHFNVYLGEPDENRAVKRHLLHLGGSFSYQHSTITVTLDRPDSPRVARALELLTEELNAHSARLLGERRPLCYRVMPAVQNWASRHECGWLRSFDQGFSACQVDSWSRRRCSADVPGLWSPIRGESRLVKGGSAEGGHA